MKISKKLFVSDMFINMIAAVLPIIVLNIIIYPLLATNITTNDYGTLTMCVGLINLVNGIWGSSVAYTRLLEKDGNIKAKNFSVLLLLSMIFAIAMNLIILWFTGCLFENISILLLSICIILIISNNYLTVEYRLVLSYKRVLLSNVFSSIGYIIGFCVLAQTGYSRWELVFVFGYGVATVYNFFTTELWRVKPEIDSRFSTLCKDTGVLVVTSSISGASTYLDKLIVYPILGATCMAYYQTASIIAKVVPMFASAISNVFLSYLVKINAISKKTYGVFIVFLIALSLIGVSICNIIVPPVIKFLYPGYYSNCLKIIPYANIIASLQMFYSFAFPLTLRYCERNSQFYIQIGRLIPYLLLVILLISRFGLTGFCIATIISQLLQLIIVVIITFRSLGGRRCESA